MCEPGVLSLYNGGRLKGRGAEDADADGGGARVTDPSNPACPLVVDVSEASEIGWCMGRMMKIVH